ncbi:hypothetical protein V1477_002215 [Vespula maculifrons]|uniref:Uncharacterized protein n=1 Tax=Vespula maculifrons TaxID=7453 RepID=A0ABD2CXB0_VESMC
MKTTFLFNFIINLIISTFDTLKWYFKYLYEGTEKIYCLDEFLSGRHSMLIWEKQIKILNIEDKMQYPISKEFDNNEYPKCFLHRSKIFCTLKRVG